jgi:catechol 2,3-dioxygenase-like lactoylglutathione lyase family enzyme
MYVMTESSESPANSGVFAFMRGDHVGLRVRDLDAAVAWYRDKLDFRVVRAFEMNGLTFTEMALAGDEMFRLELVSGAGAADRPNTIDLMDSFHLHGWHHLCLRVDDVDKTVAELKRRKVHVTLDPHYNPDWKVRVAFFADPWGNMFELLQPSDGDTR